MEIISERREFEKQLEASQARIEKLMATLEYVAMMTDVDVPSEEVKNELV